MVQYICLININSVVKKFNSIKAQIRWFLTDCVENKHQEARRQIYLLTQLEHD
jgi:hypothetical protein